MVMAGDESGGWVVLTGIALSSAVVGVGCASVNAQPASVPVVEEAQPRGVDRAIETELREHIENAHAALVAEQYARAQGIAERGIALAKEHGVEQTLVVLELRSAVSRAQIASHRTEGVRASVERTVAQARALDPKSDTCAETLFVLASLDRVELQYEAALGHALEALEIRRAAKDTRPERLVASLVQVGYLRVARGEPERAIPLLREAVTLLAPGSRERELLLALAYGNLGEAYRLSGAQQEAVQPFREASKLYVHYPAKIAMKVDMLVGLASVLSIEQRHGEVEQIIERELGAHELTPGLRLELLPHLVRAKSALGKRDEVEELLKQNRLSYRKLDVATKSITELQFEPERAPTPSADARPPPSSVKSVVQGGTVTDVAKIVTGMRPGFTACYEQQLAREPEAAGAMFVTIRVGGTGQVSGVVATTLGLPTEATDCVMWVAAAGDFAPPEGGAAVVNVPVNFMKK